MTILVNTALTISKLKARYLEPYTSEVINRFFFTQGLVGIHYGFDIQPDPITGPLAIKLVHDSTRSRSMAVIADYAQRLAFAFDEDVEQVVDLAAYTGQRVYVFLYVAYTTAGTPTEIRLRVADAAELVNPWVLSALLLGTVRVPTVGSLTVGQIDKGSTVYAGLQPGAARRWMPHNTNPEFSKGLAGLVLNKADVGTDKFISLNAPGGNIYELDMGNTTGTSGAQGPHLAGVVVPDVKVGDQILVRFTVNAASVANGATLAVQFGGTSYTVLEANSAGYETFGLLYTVAALDDYLNVFLRLNLPNANSTARFLFRRFEVFKLRQDSTLAGDTSGPADVSSRFLSFGSGPDYAYSSLTHEGVGNHPVLRLPTSGTNDSLTPPLAITEDGYTTPSLKQQTDDGPSLLRGALQGTRAFGAMTAMFPQAVLNGATLAISLPDQVVLDAGIISAAPPPTESTPYGSSSDDSLFGPFNAAYNSGLTVSVPTTGNPVVVAWNGDDPDPNSRLIAVEAISIGLYPNATLLAWVEYDTGTSQITKLIDLRDKLVNVQGKLTMYVGESTNRRARMTLEAALQLVGIFVGPSTLQNRPIANFEIVVLGSHNVLAPLQLQSHVTIRGEAYGTALGWQQPRLLLASGQTTLFTTGTASLVQVTLQNLYMAASDAACTAIKVENNRSITGLLLERCHFITFGQPWKYGLDTGATNAYVSGAVFRDCTFTHGDTSDDSYGVFLRDQSLAAGDNLFEDCTFSLNDSANRYGTHVKVNNSASGVTRMVRCTGNLIQGDDFASFIGSSRYGVELSGNTELANCQFFCSVRCYPGTAAQRIYRVTDTTVERRGDGGGTDKTWGLVLEKAGAGNTIAFLAGVAIKTDALDPFGGAGYVGVLGLLGDGVGSLILHVNGLDLTVAQGSASVDVYGIIDDTTDGIVQFLTDGVSIQGANTGIAGTHSTGIYLSANAARGILKGLRVENIDDNRAVYFAAGAIKNILGFMTVLQTSAGAGYTDVTPAANTIQTATVLVN